jgi:hypothetical protein
MNSCHGPPICDGTEDRVEDRAMGITEAEIGISVLESREWMFNQWWNLQGEGHAGV